MTAFEKITGVPLRKARRQCFATLLVGVPFAAAAVWEPGIVGFALVAAWAGGCVAAVAGLLGSAPRN